MQILDEKYSKIILEEKLLLQSLLAEIKELSNSELESKLRSVEEGLDNLFSLVFIGEFSTGKSSVINALLGQDVLPKGITPTTDEITVIKYGDRSEESVENGCRVISVPQDRLKGLFIVDTPGTNVTIAQHERLTEEYIPKADIVFFTIGAERAVTGSEAKLIKFIKESWLKNIVFLLNKIDIAADDEELGTLVRHTRDELERSFGIKPHLISVSARLAREGKTASDPVLFSRSGFGALEQYIFDTLSEEERIRMKIRAASEFAVSICAETERALAGHIDRISEDMQRLGEFEKKLDSMKDEIVENSSQFTERIRSRLLEFKTRGIEYIDELIRFTNIFKLMSKQKIAKEFEYRVSRQTVSELEKDLDAMVTWTEKSARTMLDSTIEFYNKSIRADTSNVTTGFIYDRTRLVDTVRNELETKRRAIDPATLGGNLVDSARGAVASVLGVQVGSLALGAAVVSAFSSLLVDITGILATVAVMATAFAILPKKRRDAMKEFSGKVDALIEEMISGVSSQLERDFSGIKIQVSDSLSPLRNFYKTEKQKLSESKVRVSELKSKFGEIKERAVLKS
ncbi:MAG: dynamin family protein [Candidatus Dadabacteria bacterium]|nr:dynamin family protein [Candidatus Dadabacteria bacterium]